MLGENNILEAKEVFETLCKALDNRDWSYTKNEDELTLRCGAQGEDLPIEMIITVDPERMLVLLLSQMPFTTPEDKCLDMAVAVSVINNCLVDGCFDYNVSNGNMFFRMSNSFIETKMGEDLFAYMLFCSCKTIDEYNDKLMMLAKGLLTIEQFLKDNLN